MTVERSLQHFRTVAFARSLIAENFRIQQSTIQDAGWGSIVPVAYRARVDELVTEAFSRWRGQRLTEEMLAGFVSDLHDSIWREVLPMRPFPPQLYMYAGSRPDYIRLHVELILAVRACRVIANALEPTVLRVVVRDGDFVEGTPLGPLVRMVSAVARSAVYDGTAVEASLAPVWTLADGREMPIDALSADELDEVYVENDRRARDGDMPQHDAETWGVWLGNEQRRRKGQSG